MPKLYPDRDELFEIKRAIKESGLTDPRALEQAIDDFTERNEYTIEGVDSYMVMLAKKLKKPVNVDGNPFGENADLVTQAFAGKGSADARAKLVKAIGESAANEAARKFGLSGVADFKNAGTLPEGFTPPTPAAPTKERATTNPWSEKYVGRAPADQERIRIIKAMGTRVASDLARAAHVDLAGRPLRTAAA